MSISYMADPMSFKTPLSAHAIAVDVPIAIPGDSNGFDTVSLRQLRHHTKNMLQKLLSEIRQTKDLHQTKAGLQLLEDLQRRIFLAAEISDDLFGLTRDPGLMPGRLDRLGHALIDLLSDTDQMISLSIITKGDCPEALSDMIVKVAHEMVGNAIKHGLHARLCGVIEISLLIAAPGAIVLKVSDDGWGFDMAPERGEGLRIVEDMVARNGGKVRLFRKNDRTIAEMTHPAMAIRA